MPSIQSGREQAIRAVLLACDGVMELRVTHEAGKGELCLLPGLKNLG